MAIAANPWVTELVKVKVLKFEKTGGSWRITAQDNENEEATYDACRLMGRKAHC